MTDRRGMADRWGDDRWGDDRWGDAQEAVGLV